MEVVRKEKLSYKNSLGLMIFFLVLTINCFSQVRLKIRPDMIIDEKAYPEASPWKLFDEQSAITAEPPTGKPLTNWSSYIKEGMFYPLSAIIDLGRTITISNIYIYDGSGAAGVSFYSKGPLGWELLFRDPLTSYEVWKKHTVNTPVRYLRIVSEAPKGSFSEVVIYGNQQTLPPVYKELPEKPYPVFEDFSGINILHTNDISHSRIFKNIRQFHMWAWNEANLDITGYAGYPQNTYGYSPAPGTFWDFDKAYSDYKKLGLKISPVLQGSAFWLFNSLNDSVPEWKPVSGNENPESPFSYIEHADYLYQFAARYGKVAVPASRIKLQADNALKTGLDVIESVENWNEPNKTWQGRKGLFMPFEFAAMTSADYDGHQGTMGSTVGVKNADPALPLVMAGLTGLDTVYLKAMLFWFRQNRTDNKIPFDVINLHHYSNNKGGQTGTPEYGISPEDDNLEQKVRDVQAYCRRNNLNKPLWITEFGYDVNQASGQKAKTYGTFTGEDVQAMWLVRSYLAIYAGGADKAYGFWLADNNSTKGEMFSSSGIIGSFPPAVPTPKKSWYWLATMNTVLGKYHLESKKEDGFTHICKFKNKLATDTTIYCVWNGTSDGSTKNGYRLPVNGDRAWLITPKQGSVTGVVTPLPVVNGSVSVTVTENPVYIKVYSLPVLAIENQSDKTEKDIHLYPNPASERTYLVLPENVDKAEIHIYDPNGVAVSGTELYYTPGMVEIKTDNLPIGVYTIKVKTGNEATLFKKLIVFK